MKKFSKIVLVAAKFMEILHWFATIIMLVVFIVSILASGWLSTILETGIPELGNQLTTYGFEIVAANTDNSIIMPAINLFSIGAVIILFLMAMVFRNIYLIIKKVFSKGETPFQKDITRMVRETGIFLIAVPIIGVIVSALGNVCGIHSEISVDLQGIITGSIILVLSEVFIYGSKLQKDVDGLL
ncbi:MAG: hypothetical protein UIM53_04000 [Acutalibacteraceae bacterium]|nr:hypothetical protein [Acutalibacteraceae bacterium]